MASRRNLNRRFFMRGHLRRTLFPLPYALASYLFVASASPAVAGQAQTGSIAGTVEDANGGRLPGVTITLKGPNLIREQVFVTTETGEFHFPLVPPGVYSVNAVLQGFTTIERTGVGVNVGAATRVDVVMQVASLSESVTVSAGAPAVDVDTNRIASTFTLSTLQAVPFQRDFWDVLKATPGVTNDNQSYRATTSISGAGVRQTAYTVDGTNLTDAAASYAGIRHLNFDGFEEMEVITGAMPAEVGSASGGYVNIVTKSGGNDFHGGGSYYFANDTLQSGLQDSIIAKGVRPNSTGIDRLSDAAGELGGPVTKNRVWFYGNYRRFDDDTVGIGFRYQPLSLPETNDAAFGKVSIQPSDHHKFTLIGSFINRYQPQFTYTVSPFVDLLGNWYFQERGPTISAQWQWTLNQRTLFETRFGALLKQTWYEIQPASHQPSTYNLLSNETSNAQPRGQHDWRNRYQYNAALSHFQDQLLGGSHEFKTGFDFSFFSHLQSEDSLVGYQEQYTGTQPTYVQFANGFPNRIARYKHLIDWGIYAQDRWSIGKRLTMNLGVRLSGIRFTFPAQNFGPTGVFPDLQSVPLYQPVNIPEITLANWTDVSPRLGFTYDLTGDGKTPLKASYSRYDDQVFTYLADGPMAWRTSLHRWMDLNGDGLVEPGEYGPPLQVSGIANPPDPNAKRPYWSEYLIGIERELIPHLNVAVRGTYRQNYNIFDDIDIGTAGGYFPITILDPGQDGKATPGETKTMTAYDLVPTLLGKQKTIGTNPSGASRVYKSVEFSGTKRMADGWQLFSSVLISRSVGNLSNDYGGTAGVTTNFNNPDARINEYGLLALDSTYQIKVGGTYALPWDIDIGALYLHLTGNPYTRQIRVSRDINGNLLNLGNITINAEPLGSERLPAQDTVNLNAAKRVRLARGQQLKFTLDVFNLTNQNTPLSVSTLSGPTFGAITSILPPRYIRLGVRYTF
jgi:outer membrane receptor protein involved in Fe transport